MLRNSQSDRLSTTFRDLTQWFIAAGGNHSAIPGLSLPLLRGVPRRPGRLTT